MKSSTDHPERQQKRGKRRIQTVLGRSGVAIQFALRKLLLFCSNCYHPVSFLSTGKS